MRRSRTTLLLLATLPLAAVAVLGSAVAAASDDGGEPKRIFRSNLVLAGGEDDELKIDDLDTLAVGESRTYVTENGKNVIATRDEEGVELDVDGKKIRVGGGLERIGEATVRNVVIERTDADGDGEPRVRIELRGESDDEIGHRVVLRRVGEGEHGMLFVGGARDEMLLDRLEKNEKFLSLDAATREIVREAIRESSPQWIGEGHGAHGLRIEIQGHDH